MDDSRNSTTRRWSWLVLLVLVPSGVACAEHPAADPVRPRQAPSAVSTSPAPPLLGRCRKIVFEGRRYVLEPRPPGTEAGVGAELGTGTAYRCGRAGAWTVKVYSVNEQPKEEAITVSDAQHVWVYDAVR